MQRIILKSNKHNYILAAMTLILSGCSSDLEDEKFELIPGPFPKLVDVPDRPVVPQNRPGENYFANKEKKLLEIREEAYKEKKGNLTQRKNQDQE